jgi:hypothetical protein
VSDKLPQERRWRGWREGMLTDPRVVERCAFCSFEVRAPLEKARAAFEAHECDRPKTEPTRRLRSRFSLR